MKVELPSIDTARELSYEVGKTVLTFAVKNVALGYFLSMQSPVTFSKSCFNVYAMQPVDRVLVPGYCFILGMGSAIYFSENKLELACNVLQVCAVSAVIADVTIAVLFPPSLAVQLTVKAVVLIAGAANNLHIIYQGTCKVQEAFNPQLKTAEKVTAATSGLLSIGLGVFGCVKTIQSTIKLYNGLQVYHTLAKPQQEFALKYHSLETLGEIKSKNAVIIDGLSTEWSAKSTNKWENLPTPPGGVIYENYNTRTYRVTSASELTQVLNDASKELGGKLDLVAFFGHGNPQLVRLGKTYSFRGNYQEIKAIKNTIAKAGEILLFGCSTAKQTPSSLTEHLSFYLKGKRVTGFSEILYPGHHNTTAWFNGQFRVRATTLKSNHSIVSVYKNGHLIAA